MVSIVVKILRAENIKAGVSVTVARPANGITIKSAFVAPDKDEATRNLTITKDARIGLRQDIIVNGVMKTGKETIVRYAAAIPIKVIAAQP